MIFFDDFDLAQYNAYQIKAKCATACFPENENDFLEIFSKEESTMKILIGNGNNIILSKDFYSEKFIVLNGNYNQIFTEGNEIIAEAGATTETLSELALENHLSGFETFYDIPSSVGGAVVMNAGAGGEEIKDFLVKVRYLDLADMQVKERQKEELAFEYRNSFFQKNPDKIVLKAWFRLKPGDPTAIKEKMETIKQQRWAKQPREYPNCGSVFKRPPGHYVGPMIDELGLKGFRLGGAMISPKHSGFIVNTGGATGQDILEIIAVVKEKVKERFGVELEVEQRII